MKNTKKFWSGLGKSSIVVAGTLLFGLVGAALVSLTGIIISAAFPVKGEVGPDNIAYMIGYIISIPFGIFLLSKLIMKFRMKFWILLVASIAGFGFFVLFIVWVGLEAINSDPMLMIWFVVIFHLAPWISTTLCSALMYPKAKAQNPVKEA